MATCTCGHGNGAVLKTRSDSHRISLRTRRAQARIALSGYVLPVTRWGHLQHLADRLDPTGVSMLVDEGSQDLSRQSSSAWAKKALANLRISLALRSSLTSRSSALIRSLSSLVRPSRIPLSISCLRTQSCNVWGTQPIFGTIDSTAAH